MYCICLPTLMNIGYAHCYGIVNCTHVTCMHTWSENKNRNLLADMLTTGLHGFSHVTSWELVQQHQTLEAMNICICSPLATFRIASFSHFNPPKL